MHMVDYDYLYDDEYELEEEGYWTRRQFFIVIITAIMIISLLGYMMVPLLQSAIRASAKAELPPTQIPLETAYHDPMPENTWIIFS